MLSTYVSYQIITRDLDRSLALKSAEPVVALETKYYRENIGKITSIDDFLRDTRLVNYSMKAFGLEDMAYAKGFIRKVLTEGVDDKRSFANRLADDRFVEFAKVFDFAGIGSAVTSTAAVKQGVIDRYVRQSLEMEVGADNEGVRLAMYFQRKAPEAKTAYALLGDPALWQVVKTVFGFPSEMANADIDKQAAAVTARLDIETLQDPKELSRLIQRFTAVWDAQNTVATSPVLALFDGNQQPTIGVDVLMTLQSLKHGGA